MKLLLYACYFRCIISFIKFNMNFTSYYILFHDPIWVVLLSTALFFPVRQLIWVLYVRKKQKTDKIVSDDEKKKLKNRASFTSLLLSVVFSYLYVNQVFN